jgi:hypothetical protein
MGDINQTFTGDSKQIEQVYERLKRMDLELIERQRKMHEESKKGADAFTRWGEEQQKFVTNLPQMALGFLSIERGVDAIGDKIGEWQNRIREATKEAADFALRLALGVGPQGTANLGAIKERFGDLQSRGLLTLDQSLALYSGMSSAAPALGNDRLLNLYSRVGQFGVQATPELGAGAARLAKAGISDQRAASEAFNIQRLAGGQSGEVMSDETIRAARALKNSGAVGSVEEGLALAVTMSSTGELSAKELVELANAVGSQEIMLRPRGPADFAKAKFLGTNDPRARLTLLLQGGNIAKAMLPGQAAKLGTVDWSQRGANLSAIQGTAESDLSSSGEGRRAIAAEMDATQQAEARERLARKRGNYWSWVEDQPAASPFWDSLIPSLLRPHTAGQAARFLYSSGGRTPVLGRQQFESLYAGPGQNEIGNEDYRTMLAASRAAHPDEWRGAPEKPDFDQMLRHLQGIEENTRPRVTPPPVVPGGQTERR